MLDIKINENVYGMDMDELFVMAKRINKKRSFLFVSKVLGKHIENNNHEVIYAGMLLAKRLNEVFVKADDKFDWSLNKKEFVSKYMMETYEVPEKLVFIGFAETATGLGQSVFDRFDNSLYFHTTRNRFEDRKSVLSFEEEHSHATSHLCYVDESFINNDHPVVLVDDEMTTGNTSLNIISDIHSKYPRKDYVVVSILNWMNEDEREMYREFEKANDVNIHFVYLVSGEIDRTFKEDLGESNVIRDAVSNAEYKMGRLKGVKEETNKFIKETGRFGITSQEHLSWKKELLSSYAPTDDKVLVIGNGEYMYVPILMAYALGDQKVKTTTRSPIYVDNDASYSVRSGIEFGSVDGSGVTNYLYNIANTSYDRAVFMVEGETKEREMTDFISKLTSFGSIKQVEVVNV